MAQVSPIKFPSDNCQIMSCDRENRHDLLNFHTAIFSLYTTNM